VLKKSSNRRFWEHEWRKHGTCATGSEAGGSSYKYFKTALKLYDMNPVEKWLSDAGITPSGNPSTLYSLNSIHSAIARYRLDSYTIQCRYVPQRDITGRVAKQPIIESINLCFDKSLNPITCNMPRSNCPFQVMYPTYQILA
jgi:ribonuclease T2